MMELVGQSNTPSRHVIALPSEVLATALSTLDGTVTDLLESLAHEPIVADKLSQEERIAISGNLMDLVPGEPVLHRFALLRGQRTHRRFVYADTEIAIRRLPDGVVDRLKHTDHPIGRVLDEHCVARLRLDLPTEDSAPPPSVSEDVVLTRRYRFEIGGQPAVVIQEWFLRSAADLVVDTR
jgi:chorismate-pyruvate lyase